MTTQTNTPVKSNSIIYTGSKTVKGEAITVKIRLSDECKNGHQDFSATCDFYQAGKPKIDRYFLRGGCHEDILRHFPHLKIFVDLHLCDYAGAPMYPSANGFYHLTNGFNNTPVNSPKFEAEYCEYYRITTAQFSELKKAKNKVQFAILLDKLGILTQWQEQANKAIAYLEELTGKQFLNDSKRGQHVPPTPEELAEEQERQNSGYYTAEAEIAREQAKKQAELDELQAELDAAIKKHAIEYEVKKAVLELCGTKALKNCIFYNHTQELTFNWRGYDNLTSEEIAEFTGRLLGNLPEGVAIKTAKN